MRGKVYVNGLKLIPNGITPAYAGKRIGSTFNSPYDYGSPPPMRGKV